jgi:hypothetical protein
VATTPEDNALWALQIDKWFVVEEKKLIALMLANAGYISFDDTHLRSQMVSKLSLFVLK